MKTKKTMCIIVCFLLLLVSKLFSVPKPNGPINGKINEDVYRRQRHHFRPAVYTGIGPIFGIGASKSVGTVSYEEIIGLEMPDTYPDDGKKHLFSYSFGIKYANLLMAFLPVGYSVTLSYQVYGLKIDNSKGWLYGTPYTGGEEKLFLKYVTINPVFHITFFTVGVYLSVLTRAQVGDKIVTDKFKPLDFGFTVAYDFTFPLSRSGYAISIVFEGIFGIVNIYKNSTRTYRNIGFNFKLGFLFGSLQ